MLTRKAMALTVTAAEVSDARHLGLALTPDPDDSPGIDHRMTRSVAVTIAHSQAQTRAQGDGGHIRKG